MEQIQRRSKIVHMDYGIDESTDASHAPDAANFECNICFDLAQEPIVTLCGHLYCWPCLYQWLQLHSNSHECPVCKAIVHEEKLIPIYGRGKSNSDPRSRLFPEVSVPNRPMGQRPPTAPRVDMNYARQNEGFGHQTLSTFFAALPTIFNLHVHGFHDGTLYGATSGVPYLFSSSFHGGYVHGFHNYQSAPIEWKPLAWKIAFLLLGVSIILHLILA
ncbi:hypothetical protein ABFS82_02G026700 [Erythranthe guttata]